MPEYKTRRLEAPPQQVSLEKPVYGKDLDHEAYNAKFELWDEVVKKNYLQNDKYGIRNEALRLLNDDTIYTYAYLKDDDGKAFRYTAYQDLIANLHHDFTPDNPDRYIVFKASNQIGKSRLLVNKSIKLAMTEENKNIILVSRSLPQSQFLLAQIKHALNNSGFSDSWREDLGDTANTTVLTFKKAKYDREGRVIGEIVNRIICAPSGEGLLGFPVHYLFLDEGDFYEDAKTFFWKVAFPRTKKTKGQIIIFSNPNVDIPRSESLLWEAWTGDLFQRKFSFNFLDAPWNTKEELEKDRRNSPAHIFASTHMGEFPDEAGSFLTHKEIQDMLEKKWQNRLPVAEGTIYCGVDLGKMKDTTVISIGIPKVASNEHDKYLDLDVPYQEEMPLGTPYDRIMDRMVEIREHYEARGVKVSFGHDATGQKTFGDFLKKNNVYSQEVDFSRKESNKTLLVNDFKLMVEKRKIKVVYSEKCEKQLANLQFKLTATKKLTKVENKSEVIHDDYFDSLCILVHIAVKPHVIPVSARIAIPRSTMEDAVVGEDIVAKTIKENNSVGRGVRIDPYG